MLPARLLGKWSAREQIKAYAQESSTYSILAFGNPRFASDEHRTVQARNRTTGIAMPLIKKVDVKNYLAARRHKRAHGDHATNAPAGTDASGPNAVPAKPELPVTNPPGFAEDFLAEHSSSPLSDPSANYAAGSASSQAPATSKSAQA